MALFEYAYKKNIEVEWKMDFNLQHSQWCCSGDNHETRTYVSQSRPEF